MARNSERDKKLFLENIENLPNISVVCEKLGFSRATIYRWLKVDSEFMEKTDSAYSTGRDFVNDLAESKLISNIKNGDFRSISYWLQHNHVRYMRPENRAEVIPEKPPTKAIIEFIGSDLKTYYKSYDDYCEGEEKLASLIYSNKNEEDLHGIEYVESTDVDSSVL